MINVTLLFTPCPGGLGLVPLAGPAPVIARIADLRVAQAQRHGIVVGLPRETARRIAAVADFLAVASEWRDLAFMFDALERHEGSGWKVPVDRRWWLAFGWVEGIGPVELRLIE